MVSFYSMTSDPRVHAWGGARGPNLVRTSPKCSISVVKFLEVHILTTIIQEAFILGPLEPWMVDFHSMALYPRVLARDGTRVQYLEHL